MAVLRVLLIAEILKKVGLHIARADLGSLVSHPVEILADEMKVLHAVDGRLFLRQFPLRPELKKGVVLAMLAVARGCQPSAERIYHKAPRDLTPISEPESIAPLHGPN